MVPETLANIRRGLLEKRAVLMNWLSPMPPTKKGILLGAGNEKAMENHIHVLDTALQKASEQTLGVCTVCRQPIETALLEMDYTAEVCLEHLSTEQARSLEAELELAQTVQRSLLPEQPPDIPALEIAAFSRPAQIVGGDYFDFFTFQDGADGLAIADVAGHGISASLHMASVQALLRSLIPASDSPAEVVRRVHRLLIHNVRFSTFVTLFLAAFDARTLTLRYCNAGHNPPLVFRRSANPHDAAQWLSPTGAAIGISEDSSYREGAAQLESGDVVVLYTDGVTEAMNRAGEQFGAQRLAAVVQQASASPAKALVAAIRQGLAEFSGAAALADDTTIVACRMR